MEEFWLKLLAGIRTEDLPEELDLTEIAADMQRLWQQSIAQLAQGIVQEVYRPT